MSNPVSLRAGRGYYIETLHKSDTGADFIKVAARLLGTGVPAGVPNTALDTNAVMGAAIASPMAPRDLGGPLTLVQGPTDTTVEANHFATFSVQLNNPSGLPVSYQWYRDDGAGETLITSGAFGPTYSFIATNTDNGAKFRVVASKIGSVVTSGSATLTVIPDITPPTPTNAVCSYTNLSIVVIRYDELVETNSAVELFNYGSDELEKNVARLEADGRTVTLELLAPLVAGQTYQLNVSGVKDLADNVMPDIVTLTFVAAGDLPRLSIEVVEGYVNISWPAPSTGFNLQQADAVTGGTWTSAGTPTPIGGRNVVSLVVGSGNKFFRLSQ